MQILETPGLSVSNTRAVRQTSRGFRNLPATQRELDQQAVYHQALTQAFSVLSDRSRYKCLTVMTTTSDYVLELAFSQKLKGSVSLLGAPVRHLDYSEGAMKQLMWSLDAKNVRGVCLQQGNANRAARQIFDP